MKDRIPTKSIVEGAFLSAITAILFLASLYIPLFGTLISFLCPLPIIVLCLRHNIKIAMLSLLIAFFLVTLLAGPFQGLIGILGFGSLGIALGIAIKKKLSLLEILLIGSMTSFISKIFLMLIGLWLMDVNPLLLSVDQIDRSINQSLSFYQNIGLNPEQIETVKDSLLQSLELVRIAFPAMLVIASVFDTIINYWVAGIILKRLGYPLEPIVPFHKWQASKSFFWSYLFGLVILLLNTQYNLLVLERIGVNIQILFSVIFLITGLSVVSYVLRHYRVKPFFCWMIYIVIFIQPLFSLIVTWAGILDVWVDFRKLLFPKEQNE
ncbi:MAG: YybS family protein [Arcobacteraceae bacterium]